MNLAKKLLMFVILGFVCVFAVIGQTNVANLDAAIQQAARDINQRITAPRVALVSFNSSNDLSAYVLRGMAAFMENSRIPQLTPRENIDRALSGLNLNSFGEVSDANARQIGRTVGADFVVTGRLVRIGDNYRFRTTLINVITGTVQATTDFSIRDSQQIERLLGQVAPVATPAPVAAPAPVAPAPVAVPPPASAPVVTPAQTPLPSTPAATQPAATASPSPPVSEVHQFELRVFELTNIERAKHGLRPLIWHETLAAAARIHSEDMMRNNFLGHTGSDGSTVRQRIERAGVTNANSWSENCAAGQRSPEAVVQSWMNSPGHRANILSENSTHLGVGFVQRPEGSRANAATYWTQKFIRVR
jgi:uncharacterized protein YkwD